jgi:hypothetical protein
MSRAQDRSSGLQTGAQAAEKGAGATGTGMTSGAGSTGPTTGTTPTPATGTTAETEGTTRGMRDPAGGQMSSGRMQGTQPTTGRAPAQGAHRMGAGSAIGGSLAVVAGLLTFLAGLSVVVRPRFYPTLTNYAYQWNGRGWGWILLVLGVLLFAAGASALLGIAMSRIVGVGLAVLTAIAGFLFLPYRPVFGIVIVALSVLAIWGLLHDGEPSRSTM